MALTTSERKQLVRELRQIQQEVPEVEVRIDLMAEALATAQSRVNSIERMLASDDGVRSPPQSLD